MKDREKWKLSSAIKSIVIKVFLLLLAIALLIAGIYYQRVAPKPVQVPIKLGKAAEMVAMIPDGKDKPSARKASLP